MLSNSEFFLGWWKILWCCMIHHQKWADTFYFLRVHREDGTDVKSISNPMLFPWANYFLNLFLFSHQLLPSNTLNVDTKFLGIT
jgi:hypothetical protein